MDGASKFVRGDAVAGLLIMVINVVGGLLVGVLQHNMALVMQQKPIPCSPLAMVWLLKSLRW